LQGLRALNRATQGRRSRRVVIVESMLTLLSVCPTLLRIQNYNPSCLWNDFNPCQILLLTFEQHRTGRSSNPPSTDHSAAQSSSAPPPPGYDSTTQHTWALILSLCSRIPQDNAALRSDPKVWQSGFSLALGGKTLGLVGLGKLGANAARIGAQAFGMKVIAWSENLTQDKADSAAEGAGLERGTFKAVSKEELFQTADVISLHYVLSPRSRGIVGAGELGMMRSTSVLINSSRGPLIDESALLATLEKGGIRGAALDVWWQEPLSEDSPWRRYSGKSELVMSPHMGYVNEGK
jgi:phosphoglycerate dehydrogenase-like enzyme